MLFKLNLKEIRENSEDIAIEVTEFGDLVKIFFLNKEDYDDIDLKFILNPQLRRQHEGYGFIFVRAEPHGQVYYLKNNSGILSLLSEQVFVTPMSSKGKILGQIFW